MSVYKFELLDFIGPACIGVLLGMGLYAGLDRLEEEPRNKCESAGSAWVCSLRPFIGPDGVERKSESCACLSNVGTP